MVNKSYYKIARENEQVFRSVLRDLVLNRDKRTWGGYVPEDLETEVSLQQIFEKYSEGDRTWKFVILDFSRPNQETAQLSFENVGPLSGGGLNLEYVVKGDSKVELAKILRSWVS